MKTAKKNFSPQAVTQQIIGSAFEVHNVLGFGFLEKVYQRAIQVELQSRGMKVGSEPKIQVRFKGVVAGGYAADLQVETKSLWNEN
jgi:GxxExxY protein